MEENEPLYHTPPARPQPPFYRPEGVPTWFVTLSMPDEIEDPVTFDGTRQLRACYVMAHKVTDENKTPMPVRVLYPHKSGDRFYAFEPGGGEGWIQGSTWYAENPAKWDGSPDGPQQIEWKEQWDHPFSHTCDLSIDGKDEQGLPTYTVSFEQIKLARSAGVAHRPYVDTAGIKVPATKGEVYYTNEGKLVLLTAHELLDPAYQLTGPKSRREASPPPNLER